MAGAAGGGQAGLKPQGSWQQPVISPGPGSPLVPAWGGSRAPLSFSLPVAGELAAGSAAAPPHLSNPPRPTAHLWMIMGLHTACR
jgi:hypothetical protein